jgi:hypothetical protein
MTVVTLGEFLVARKEDATLGCGGSEGGGDLNSGGSAGRRHACGVDADHAQPAAGATDSSNRFSLRGNVSYDHTAGKQTQRRAL